MHILTNILLAFYAPCFISFDTDYSIIHVRKGSDTKYIVIYSHCYLSEVLFTHIYFFLALCHFSFYLVFRSNRPLMLLIIETVQIQWFWLRTLATSSFLACRIWILHWVVCIPVLGSRIIEVVGRCILCFRGIILSIPGMLQYFPCWDSHSKLS
jgi:hypothetical protein